MCLQEAANLVLKKHLKLRDRELRLSHAKANATPSKRKNSNEDTYASPAKKFAVDPTTPGSRGKRTEKASLSYQGMRGTKSSSVQKKSHPRTSEQPKSKSRLQVAKKQTERKTKRPAVAARKAKALKNATAPSKQIGTKRKLENRTPSSAAGRKKKLRKF